MKIIGLAISLLFLTKVKASRVSCLSLSNTTNIGIFNATLLNSTYFASKQMVVSNSTNSIPLCQIYSSVNYGPGNTLYFATWLPDPEYYTGRFLAVGNGGFGGSIDFQTMMEQFNSGNGFAVTGGDSGHSGLTNGIDGFGAPGLYIPFFHRDASTSAWIHNAIALFTDPARSIVRNFYNSSIKFSYYHGCSTGGGQGLSLAEFYPDLYDGIYAGSIGNWYSHLILSFLWNAQHTNTTETYLSNKTLTTVYQAVLKECDAMDGLRDGLIEDPLKCNFSLESLACKNDTLSTECLTTAQIGALKAIYAGPKRSDTNEQLYPGFTVGAEIELLLQEGLISDAVTVPLLQNRVYNDLTYNANNFNWASDVDLLDQRAGTFINANNPNLTTFRSAGGKLLSTQGWMDPLNAPTWVLRYLGEVNQLNGGSQDFYRVFMVPGGGHCGAATFEDNVPAKYDVMKPLIDWVEKGQVATQVYTYDPPDGSSRTRKLCAWPQTANYTGGDANVWTNYECVNSAG